MTTTQTTATTILNQIGFWGRASLGAREYVDLGEGVGVQFRIGPGRRNLKAVVSVNDQDLYDVAIIQIKRDFTARTLTESTGIYAGSLAEHLVSALADIS